MPIFVVFVSAGVLFDSAFSLSVSLSDRNGTRTHNHLVPNHLVSIFLRTKQVRVPLESLTYTPKNLA